MVSTSDSRGVGSWWDEPRPFLGTDGAFHAKIVGGGLARA